MNEMGSRLRKACYHDRLPGLLPGEVHAEMLEVLWLAASTYDPERNDSFPAWFYLRWTQHKSRYLRDFFALKRAAMETVLTDWEAEAFHPTVPGPDDLFSTPPIDGGDTVNAMWQMIREGYRSNEVRSMLGLSLRAYYSIIHQWRDYLLEGGA